MTAAFSMDSHEALQHSGVSTRVGGPCPQHDPVAMGGFARGWGGRQGGWGKPGWLSWQSQRLGERCRCVINGAAGKARRRRRPRSPRGDRARPAGQSCGARSAERGFPGAPYRVRGGSQATDKSMALIYRAFGTPQPGRGRPCGPPRSGPAQDRGLRPPRAANLRKLENRFQWDGAPTIRTRASGAGRLRRFSGGAGVRLPWAPLKF
jgi:hypothetical protein